MFLGFVYKIENINDGKVFVGRTLDIERCIRQKFIASWKDPLSEAIKKEGKDVFKVEILYTVVEHRNDKLDVARFAIQDQWEKWVKKLDSYNPDKGYNLPNKKRAMEAEVEAEIKGRITKTNSRKGRTPHIRPVAMYDLKGNLIREFDSIRQAHIETGVSTGSICNCCRGFSQKSIMHLNGGDFQYVKFFYL